eukprot:1154661-Pelagomonas_calceolata.AAC.4
MDLDQIAKGECQRGHAGCMRTCKWFCRRALPSSFAASKETKHSPFERGTLAPPENRGNVLLCRVCADQRMWRERSSRTKTGPKSDLRREDCLYWRTNDHRRGLLVKEDG